jgi:cobalt/nickel transport system permease protein
VAFILVVVSFPKYDVVALLPLFFFPIIMVSLANLPIGFFVRKLALVSPFAIFIGIFNPLLDRQVFFELGPLAITGGWVSFGSVMIRFVLTVGAAIILIATTSFPGVCAALERLKVPRLFVVQMMLLYRFIFVLVEESLRLMRARSMRSFGGKGPNIGLFVRLLGSLFLRTMDRAERVYCAMRSRGFDGEIRVLRRSTFGGRDLAFLSAAVTVFALIRYFNITEVLGTLALRVLG